MNIDIFLQYKNLDECKYINEDKLILLNDLIGNKIKNIKKNNLNILKNHKIQNKKETITSKINLILNKLSNNNVDQLLNEFIENINKIDIIVFNEIINIIYKKMINDIKFVNDYIIFLFKLIMIYNSVLNYNEEYIISLIESQFKYIYCDIKTDFNIILDLDEIFRINTQIIIKKLVDYNILSTDVLEECKTIILNQNKYLTDIYNWIKLIDKKISTEDTLIIKDKIAKANNIRDIVLLESLFINNDNCININVINKSNDNKDVFQLECYNIFDEYIMIELLEDVIYFIHNKCINNINIFLMHLFNKYFSTNKYESSKLSELLHLLLNKNIITKELSLNIFNTFTKNNNILDKIKYQKIYDLLK